MRTIIAIALIIFPMFGAQRAQADDKQWFDAMQALIAEADRNVAFIEAWRNEACARVKGQERDRCNAFFRHVIERRKTDKPELESLIELKRIGLDDDVRRLLIDRYNDRMLATNAMKDSAFLKYPVSDPQNVKSKKK